MPKEIKKQPVAATKAQAAKPATQVKHEFYPEREPADYQLGHILDAAQKKGVPASYIAALIHHESAHKWHEKVRPLNEKGMATTSALGLGQYLDSTWMYHLYSKGETLIADTGLDKKNPKQAASIRQLKAEFDSKPGKKDWAYFDNLMKRPGTSEKYKAVLDLRAEGELSVHAVAQDIQDSMTSLKNAGLPVNLTNVYILHHKNAAFLQAITSRPNDVPALSAGEVNNNGFLFKTADGTPKTGAQIHDAYASVMNDASARAFTQGYLGVGAYQGSATSPKAKKGEKLIALPAMVSGQRAVTVREGLLFGPMTASERARFSSTYQTQALADKNTPQMQKWAIDRLKDIGFIPKIAAPKSLSDPIAQSALRGYAQRMGLNASAIQNMRTGLVASLEVTSSRVHAYSALQQEQVKSPLVIDLKAVTPSLQDQFAPQIIKLKEALVKEGYLKPKTEKHRELLGKRMVTRTITLPPTAEVGKDLISALNAAQLSKGLRVTEGRLDAQTMAILTGGTSSPSASFAAGQAMPSAPTKADAPATRGRAGRIGGPSSPIPEGAPLGFQTAPGFDFNALASTSYVSLEPLAMATPALSAQPEPPAPAPHDTAKAMPVIVAAARRRSLSPKPGGGLA